MYEDDSDIVQVEVRLLDKNGSCASSDEIIYYQLVGDGKILGIENGKPDDLTCYNEKYRSTYGGKAIVYVRKGNSTDFLTLHAYTKSGLYCERKIK